MPLSTTYTKAETDYLLQTLQRDFASGIKGTLKITDTAPTIQGLYILSEVGTYTNLGGLVTTAGKINYAYFDGTTWSKVEVVLQKGADGRTIEMWSAKDYVVGSQVFYNGEIYEANEAASSTDIPNENPLIWKKVLSNNIIYAEADFEISDENSKSIVKFLDGHVLTKNFDSRNLKIDDSVEDFEISDENKKSIVRFIDGHIQTKNFDSKNINTETTRDLKILFIGNSFSSDSAMYLPAHLKNIAPEINLTVGIAAVGGCTLQMHYNYSQNNQPVYFYHKSVGGNKWTTTSGKTLQEAITQDDWDIISFQQQSATSRDYATYQPYLNNLVNWVYGLRNNVRLAWLFTPPLPTGGIGMPSGMTSDQFFQDMTIAVSKVMNETAIELLFPCGTAIQNARTTTLNNIGGFGQLTYEGLHLNEGIACQIATYVLAEKICKIMGVPRSIFGNNIVADQNFITSNNILELEGTPSGSNSENRLLAQKSVIMAIKKPFEITNINF